MVNASIRVIHLAEDPGLDRLLPLFTDMHEEMTAQGMMLRLAKGGPERWLDGLRNGLERFGRLVVADADGSVVGFAQATVKLAPEHLGGARIGHIAHVYVLPEHRRTGIARQLAISLLEWLRAKEVGSIELQVVRGNEAGLAFWRSLGFEVELVQMRTLRT